MTIYNVFDLEEEAKLAQAIDYAKLIEGADDAYIATTDQWSDVIEFPDGRWGYAVYPYSDHVYRTVDFTPTEIMVD